MESTMTADARGRRKRWRDVVMTGLIAAIILAPSAANARQPDPVALLRGVEAARSGIRSGRIEFAIENQQRRPFEQTDTFSLSVVFDGVKRRCAQSIRTVVARGGVDAQSKLTAMGHNRDEFVQAGYGSWLETRVRSIWDGANYSQYGKELGAGYRDQTKGTSELVIDPRLLGLVDGHRMVNTLGDALPYRVAKSVTVAGSDTLAGRATWRVVIVYPESREIHYWIDPQDGFKVIKALVRYGVVEETINSEYNAQLAGELPWREVTEMRTKGGEVSRRMTVEIKRAEFGTAVPPEEFTWKAMEMPVGVPVSDSRVRRRLGYWDGEKIVDDLRTAEARGRQRELETPRSDSWSSARLVATATVVLLAVLALVFNFRRRNATGH